MIRLLPVAALAFGLVACENVDYVELSPSDITFKALGEQRALEAKCMSRAGLRSTQAKVVWSVKDPDIASVEKNGVVKPLKSGQTEVIAKYNKEIEARASVTVLLVERIDVQPSKLTISQDDSPAPVKVISYGFDGRVLDTRPATFNTRDQKVARVAGGNAIMPLDPGTTTIDVQVDGHKASIEVTVEKGKK